MVQLFVELMNAGATARMVTGRHSHPSDVGGGRRQERRPGGLPTWPFLILSGCGERPPREFEMTTQHPPTKSSRKSN